MTIIWTSNILADVVVSTHQNVLVANVLHIFQDFVHLFDVLLGKLLEWVDAPCNFTARVIIIPLVYCPVLTLRNPVVGFDVSPIEADREAIGACTFSWVALTCICIFRYLFIRFDWSSILRHTPFFANNSIILELFLTIIIWLSGQINMDLFLLRYHELSSKCNSNTQYRHNKFYSYYIPLWSSVFQLVFLFEKE